MPGASLRHETVRFVELLGICGLAITQPVLDVFGDNPEQFSFRGASNTDIILFPLLVGFVPAAALWLPGALARACSQLAGQVVHLAAIAVALLAGLLQVIPNVLDTGPLTTALSAGLGTAGGVWLFERFEAARSWTRVISFFSIAFVGLFLFGTPAGDLAFASTPELVELPPDQAGPAEAEAVLEDDEQAGYPDVVMIVLDELPTALLLDPEGSIDEVRYPALADLADDATWYRTHTTVSAQTFAAVPAILSGQVSTDRDAVVWTERPDTIFRLLGGTYHLTVSEAFTRLCPEEWCGSAPIPPPAMAPSANDETPPETVTGEVPEIEDDRGGLRRLIEDAVDVWTDQIALERDDSPVFTGFEETTVQTSPAPSTTATPPSTTEARALDAPVNETGEEVDLNRIGPDRETQIPRVEAFRAAIRASDEPSFYYLHLVLPHQPLVFAETGATYSGFNNDFFVVQSEWDTLLLAEQMSLQMRFADQLVGEVLDDMRNAGIYDDALVVVMADHGASIDTRKLYRYYDGTNAAELMLTPLLMKLPGQTAGTLSDAPAEVVDVMPTIADVLGLAVPWTMDGSSLRGRDPNPAETGCDDTRRFVRFGLDLLPETEDREVEHFELCAAELVPTGLHPLLGELRADDELATMGLARLTPYADLMGLRWQELDTEPGTATYTLDERDTVLHGASPPVAVVRGAVEGAGDEAWVAIALDGRVAAISAIHDRRRMDIAFQRADPADDRFSMLVPTALFDATGYDVQIATLETIDGELIATELQPAG